MSERNSNLNNASEQDCRIVSSGSEQTVASKTLSAQAQRKQTIRKFIVISAVVLLCLSLVALIYNITMLSSTNATNRRLVREQDAIAQQIEQNEDAIYFRQSPEFIENFARYYLNMHHRDETIFVGRR